jgi:hypothetical protein
MPTTGGATTMTDKPITWSQGVAVVGSAFGLCCAGFMLLHSMILNDKAEAASQLTKAIENRNIQINRMADMFESYRNANDLDHKEILKMLMSIQKELK